MYKTKETKKYLLGHPIGELGYRQRFFGAVAHAAARHHVALGVASSIVDSINPAIPKRANRILVLLYVGRLRTAVPTGRRNNSYNLFARKPPLMPRSQRRTVEADRPILRAKSLML